MTKLSRSGVFLGGSYLMLYLIFLVLSFRELYHSASAFWGIGPTLVSVWSLELTPILDSIGYISWYDGLLSHSRFLYGFFATLPSTLAALLNGAILYCIGMALERIFSQKGTRES